MIPTLSIIIPTIARVTLCNALGSTIGQLLPGDEVLVEFDEPKTGNWGEQPRDRAMLRAKGTHLLFMDDDDVYEPGGLATVRETVAQNPDSLHIFQARWVHQGSPGRIKWDKPEFSGGQCPTICIVAPRAIIEKGVRWCSIGANVHQDLEFAKLCAMATAPNLVQWVPKVISACRPIRDDDPYVKWDGWYVNKRVRRRP